MFWVNRSLPPGHPRAFRRADPKSLRLVFGSPVLKIFQILGGLFPSPQSSKFRIPQNAPKSKKSDLGAFSASIVVVSWIPFWLPFLYISLLPENSCFATGIMRNACFCLSNQKSIPAPKTCFSRRLPGHCFLSSC